MAKNVNSSGSSFSGFMDKLNAYFSRLNTSELIAYGALFLGILLIIIGITML